MNRAAGFRPAGRVTAAGPFLWAGDEKLYVRGVTYGTFEPDENGDEFPAPPVVERDFAAMATAGINAVRTYTVPPRSVLDTAQRHGLRIMVGLAAERYVGYLTDTDGAPDVVALVRDHVRRCAGHPAVLCFAVANEIPAPTGRWLGAKRLERHIERLHDATKAEDPQALVTYVNYPSTEYLELPFLDFVSFNVYLEEQHQLEAYLRRLQNLAGDRPLVLAEVGLDSYRHGLDAQAEGLEWQLRTAFAGGCAGTFVYSWTDEWFRGGEHVDDWDFGLTDRARRPKPALETVQRVYAAPFAEKREWPRISVIVCTHNGARTLRECLDAVQRLDYPNFEAIVVDDGSTDATAAIVRDCGVTCITSDHRGLANARNVGLTAAAGEIVAYIDDDAYPDPHWLRYLAETLSDERFVAAGGPNVAPRDEALIAQAVACAPGGPVHILVDDAEAEHIPGCNMAFRRQALQAIGGFDPQFRIAGDDVDICWRLHQRGQAIGFSPAALVWHRRRGSLRSYWRQQRNYGKAEGLLAYKWPEKYNGIGHVRWSGRVYGNGLLGASRRRGGLIYHGVWGSAPFQSLYQPASSLVEGLPAMPEWSLLMGALAGLTALGVAWTPLFLSAPLLLLMLIASVVRAATTPLRPAYAARGRVVRLQLRMLTTSLGLLQPLARLIGRVGQGLTPWPRRGASGFAFPRRRRFAHWSDAWEFPHRRIRLLAATLRAGGAVVLSGGDFDSWDLEVRAGMIGRARLQVACEDHPGGTQLVRTRVVPRCSRLAPPIVVLLGALCSLAALDGAHVAAGVLGLAALLCAAAAVVECGFATAAAVRAVERTNAGLDDEHPRPLSDVARSALFRDELGIPERV
jgi:GT2 family glycosyltransferase